MHTQRSRALCGASIANAADGANSIDLNRDPRCAGLEACSAQAMTSQTPMRISTNAAITLLTWQESQKQLLDEGVVHVLFSCTFFRFAVDALLPLLRICCVYFRGERIGTIEQRVNKLPRGTQFFLLRGSGTGALRTEVSIRLFLPASLSHG